MATKKESKSEDRVNISNEPHILPCQMTDEEVAGSAELLADTIQAIESLEIARKTQTKEYNAAKQHLQDSVHRLSKQVKEGEEVRSVDCELHLNYSKLTATVVRTDTLTTVSERPMSADEKQMDLGFDKDENPTD